jgi:hypothetical protein
MSYSTPVVSQPVMVSSWLVSIETMGNQYSQVPEVLHFISCRDADTIIERH